ncbi:DUF4956 domain-containing protein [Saccharophagus sp. K07]|jgi:hypothetical protein|uniref:DUF4956 domain-containing protein n=1 Tax=Saccharophagus sp. K07 TaxID=2283636 RepID=UPI00165240EF|nr:DUF4956 domain-containing protein [Saccharophagus sp. K07]MBC6906683.1 DUF4956 domain-containing protein [Saccharophagus sp. K07]
MLSYDFLIRYVILLVGSTILLRGVYFRVSPNRDAVFSFFLFVNGVFFVTYLLSGIELSMGFAFGLFAVFAMLRYRTEPITIREMTYLFVSIGVSLMCAVAKLEYWEMAALLALVIVLASVGETRLLAPRIVEKKITYDKVELIKPERYDDLVQDLRSRTGFDIIKIEVGMIDYLDDSALLTVFCREKR